MEGNVNHMLSLLIFALLSIASLYGYKVEKYGLMLPNLHPNMPELLLCSSIRLNSTTNHYIVEFEPSASKKIIHHMVLYGCSEPARMDPVWNCALTNTEFVKDHLETDPPCALGSTVLYAWAKGAPKLELPPDVGFKVGGDSAIQYLVLQIHYASVHQPKEDIPDHSGVILHYSDQPTGKLGGLFTLGADRNVPPMSEARWESACMIRENKTIHPFAFCVHTHWLGTVVTGYHVKTDGNGQNHWTLIGKKDPQKPHMFYPVTNNVTITEGDILAARCSYFSNRKNVTNAGPTNKDEMCNFYIMYYVEEGEPLEQKYCFSRGPPFYYWNSELNNIPDKDASTLE